MSTTEADFELEISRSYLLSTVREMVAWTARSAYSTCFSEGEDFTCAIFDAGGRLVVQAAGLPAHMGTLIDAVRAVRTAYDVFEPGDVVVHNDPFNGGSHQADVLVARPLFHQNALIGFAVNKGHWLDIGGASAGGWDGSVTNYIQEGLIIPPMKLYEHGALRREVRDVILRNVRMPQYIWGDLQSQIASSVMAERRINELADRIGTQVLRDTMDASITYSERHFLKHLAAAPQGVASAEDVMEDDGHGNGPYSLHVRLEVRHNRVLVDYEGTAPQALGPINATIACARASAYAAVIAAIDPSVPVSSGCLDLIDVHVPPACFLNAQSPVPVFSGTADPGNRAAETIIRAFARLAPARACAGSYATGNNTVGFGVDQKGREFLWYAFESGGCGARRDVDGNSAEWHIMANCKNESMEIWEARFPVQFESYALVPDSGGAGCKRGGLGTERRFRLLADASVSAIADRHRVPSWGLEGGGSGACNAFRVERDGRTLCPSELGAQSDSKFGRLPLRTGDVYVIRQGGGGGFGPPAERSFAEIDRDLELGYISLEAAEEEYQVVVCPLVSPPRVDIEASLRLRGWN